MRTSRVSSWFFCRYFADIDMKNGKLSGSYRSSEEVQKIG